MNLKTSVLLFKTLVFPIVFTCALLLGACSSAPTPSDLPKNGKTVQMNMFTYGYEPTDLTIKYGDTINFVNKTQQDKWPASNIHPTHGIYPQFDPKKPVPPGSSWSFTFARRGLFSYHDHINPQITGFITVE